MNFNLINSLILAGIIQGLIFSGVVVASQKYRSPNTLFLSALIICFSFSNLQYYLVDTHIITIQQLYRFLYIPWSLLTPAIFLFYGTGFPEYINSLRVEEAKHYLSNPDFSNYTLVAIGLEAGYTVIISQEKNIKTLRVVKR